MHRLPQQQQQQQQHRQLSEYNCAYRRASQQPSQLDSSIVSKRAGQPSDRQARALEQAKRAHLLARSHWPAGACPGSRGSQDGQTAWGAGSEASSRSVRSPSRTPSRSPPRTPPRTPQRTPTRTPQRTPSRSPQRTPSETPHSTPRSAHAQYRPRSKDESQLEECPQEPYCRGAATAGDLAVPSPAAAAERLCREWEAWCNDIAQAAEAGTELPEPPVPKGAVVAAVPSALVRVTEASAFAAAALARSGAEAQQRAASLGRELQRVRGELHRLQACRRLEESQTGRCNGAATRRCVGEGTLQDDRAELARVRAELRESEELRHREVEEARAVAGTAQARLEQTLATLRQLVTMPGDQMTPPSSPPVPMPAPERDSLGRSTLGVCTRRHHQPQPQEPLAAWPVHGQPGTNWMAPRFGRSAQPEAHALDDCGGVETAEANRTLEREVQELCRSLGGTVLPKPAARGLKCASGAGCSRGGPPPRGGGVRQGVAPRRSHVH